MSTFAHRSARAIAAGILITVGGCADNAVAPGAPRVETGLLTVAAPAASFSRSGSAARVIGPAGGVIATAEGHTLAFPAGALAAPTEIRMAARAGYVGVNLEPHGLVFPAGREPVLSLNTAGSSAGEYGSFRVLYVDDAGAVLEVLPARLRGSRLETRLRHFSGYIGQGTRCQDDTGAEIQCPDAGQGTTTGETPTP